MPKTKTDTITRALRVLGVLSNDETARAEDHAYCVEALDAAVAEMATQGITATIDADALPDAVFRKWADLVAADVASHYGMSGPPRAKAILGLRAYYLPDDRTDRRDTDNDGTVSTDEADAGLRTAYY